MARDRVSRPTGPALRARGLRVRVKTAKGRKPSSARWLDRQLNDPYVAEAARHGYRSRAAWKLVQLDDRFRLLRRGAAVLDLGAAPGGWTQVAVERVGPSGRVVAVDLAAIEPIAGAEILQVDVHDGSADAAIAAALGRKAAVVLSDMAPPASGHRSTDHLKSMALCEAAIALARDMLAAGGALVLKVLQGGGERDLVADLRADFAQARLVKPEASRSESREMYVVATGFAGARPLSDSPPRRV
jgi:23S rRNA (uridine2552-2'-O)-methyltransferase